MPDFSTPAVLLRRVEYGDYDLILTFFTRSEGKIPVIAKSAKKSVKRFGGMLELFSLLNIVCATGPGRRLPLLRETSLDAGLPKLAADITKTAIAGYWAEIVNEWSEEGKQQIHLYHLLRYALIELNRGEIPPPVLSMAFQMKFLSLAGLAPNLTDCQACNRKITDMEGNHLSFNIKTGRLTCSQCQKTTTEGLHLTKGTVRQLQWMDRIPLNQVSRIRCLPQAIKEGQAFLETFLPHHLGKRPKSLDFLNKIRS
ncbi:MAG: DNA repair protein RecO [Desulfobacterales bacterium]|jgi:DNA repair protein RecO (recombination protein O)|nr:DNA repair protein RecO [Desulfobacterales bacterium]